MNEKNLKIRKAELNSIWNSLEPCLRERLTSVDSILITIYKEAQIFGVPKQHVEEFIQREFWELAREVTSA